MQTPTTETTPVETAENESLLTPAAPSVEEVVNFVRRDSVEAPQEYLDEVNVPGGGE